MFSKLNCLSFSERVKYRKTTLVKSSDSYVYDKYIHTTFTYSLKEAIDSYGIDDSFCQKLLRYEFFSVSVANMWNDLPPQLRTIIRLNSFKRELRKIFFSHYRASLIV